MNSLTQERIEEFQEKIFTWWAKHKRDFPWRDTTDPYHILVAEFMLQQTQATRVVPKYHTFLETFPTLQALAHAEKREVLKVWSGLGYNRRAVWLQECAASLAQLDDFPRDPSKLQEFKGIGPYTSRAILIFAYNMDISTVDANIRRVLITEGFATEDMSKRQLFNIAEELVPQGRSREWHNALMDYGSLEVSANDSDIASRTSQSKFEGSNRQFRGRVVKYLTEHGKTKKSVLVEECDIPQGQVAEVFTSLVEDNLIEQVNKKYRLPIK